MFLTSTTAKPHVVKTLLTADSRCTMTTFYKSYFFTLLAKEVMFSIAFVLSDCLFVYLFFFLFDFLSIC